MESSPQPAARPVVTLRFEKFSSFVEEYASNLSLGGMFVGTSEVRPVGQVVGLEVELGDGFRLIEGVGEVAWVRSRAAGADRPAGIALRFQALDEQGRELILKILEEQVKSGGKPFDVDEVPADAETDTTTVGTSSAGPPSPVDDETRWSAEATALKEKPTAPTETAPTAGETPRDLDFQAPWGEGLPEIPQEILQDSGPTGAVPEVEPVLPKVEPLGPESVPVGPEEEASTDDRGGSVPSVHVLVNETTEISNIATEVEPRPTRIETPITGEEPAPAIPTTPEPGFVVEEEPTPDLASRPPAAESATRHPATPGFPSAAAPPAADPTAQASGPILDYEDDLFRDEAPERRSLSARAVKPLAALLLLALVAGAFHYRHPLARRLGLARSPQAEPTPVAAAARRPPSGGQGPAQAGPATGTRQVDADPGQGGAFAEPPAAPTDPPPNASPGDPVIAAGAPGLAQQAAAMTGVTFAERVKDITWRSNAEGTEVTLHLDGQLGDRRITHDRLEWAPDREQVTLTGIALPYNAAVIRVQTPELKQIRTGLHSAAGATELRLVFDFSIDDATIADLRELGDRVQVVIRRPAS